jgi:Protein of unknown function (DUF1488)
MGLTFLNSRATFDRNRRGIAFTAEDDGKPIPFLVTVQALETLGLRGDPSKTPRPGSKRIGARLNVSLRQS